METAVIITIATVLIILGLTIITRWLVPKALSDDHDEQPPI